MLVSIPDKETVVYIAVPTCSLSLMPSCSEQPLRLYVAALGPVMAIESSHLNVVFGEIFKYYKAACIFKD